MLLKRVGILIAFCSMPLLAYQWVVTLNCHVPNGFTYKQAKVSINGGDYSYEVKRYINNHKKQMSNICERQAGSGYWFDGIYDISRK